jgi:hypothetical protein
LVLLGVRAVIRDKEAFLLENGVLRRAGNPFELVKSYSGKCGLFHACDLNALSGNGSNLDLYDSMSYMMNVQVECAPRPEILRRLFEMNVRAVLTLPCEADLEKFAPKKRLLVGKSEGGAVDARVFDYYVESEKDAELLQKEGKRIFLRSNTMDHKEAEKKKVFCIIRDAEAFHKA